MENDNGNYSIIMSIGSESNLRSLTHGSRTIYCKSAVTSSTSSNCLSTANMEWEATRAQGRGGGYVFYSFVPANEIDTPN
jgi:hypothetical protein